jgi:gamma-glutamyl-gamma-aminobutyrate hydrolase PuuD
MDTTTAATTSPAETTHHYEKGIRLMTTTPEQCRWLGRERVDCEEAIDRIEELLRIHGGDEVRQKVYGQKLAEKKERLSVVTETYRLAGCRKTMDDEHERNRACSLDLGTRGKQ